MTLARTEISLEVCCRDDVCANLAGPLQRQLAHGRYDRCAVMEIPASFKGWEAEHRTASKRAKRALRRGYYVTQFKREHHEDEIHAINTSKGERQGRPMTQGYMERQSFSPLPDYRCDRHNVKTWGVFSGGNVLVGYLVFYRCGDLVLVSQILGHGDFEQDETMWLLFAVALADEIGNPGFVVYNRWDSGTRGLQWFKERLGFGERAVEWVA